MRKVLVLFIVVLFFAGCRKKDLSDYPGYVDPKHVRLFAYLGEWWEGHDVVEMPDGRYAATGVRDFAGDNMKVAIVVVSSSGDSLGVYYLPYQARGTNIVALDNDRVAVKDRYGIHIFSLSDGRLERTIDLGYNREIADENDVMLYEGRSGSFLVLWGSDDGLCLRQVFTDGTDGWMACSGIDAIPGAVKPVDDGYVIVGSRTDGILLFKVDTLGNTVWVNKVSLPFADGIILIPAYSVEIADNEDLLIAVENNNNETSSSIPTVIRTDSMGNIKWIRNYNSPGDSIEEFYGYNFRILRIREESYFVMGRNWQCPTGYCIGLFKINGDGNVIMAKNYFWFSSHLPYNFIKTSDGNVVIVGVSGMDSTDYFFLFKIDPEGRPVW